MFTKFAQVKKETIHFLTLRTMIFFLERRNLIFDIHFIDFDLVLLSFIINKGFHLSKYDKF